LAQDLDRLARRGSRDGPLSAGSPASDTLSPFRGGYGRGRGGRGGRGRGGYYDDYHGRGPSPDPNWNRRTQPSATPPPQVPAFGSASTAPPSAPKIPTAPAAAAIPPTGPAISSVTGISVPTAPRVHYGRPGGGKITSKKWSNPDLLAPRNSVSDSSRPDFATALSNSQRPPTPVKPSDASLSRPYGPDSRPHDRKSIEALSPRKVQDSENKIEQIPASPPARRKRRPIYGKRASVLPSRESPEAVDDVSDDSDADSVDSIGRAEFLEEDMKKIQEEISKLPRRIGDDEPLNEELVQLYDLAEPEQEDDEQREERLAFIKNLKQQLHEENLLELNPLRPANDLDAFLLTKVYLDSSLDDEESFLFKARRFVSKPSEVPETCVPTNGQLEDKELLDVGDLPPKVEDQEMQKVFGTDRNAKPIVNGRDTVSQLEAQASGQPQFASESLSGGALGLLQSGKAPHLEEIKLLANGHTVTNGQPKSAPMMDNFEVSEDEMTEAERQEELESVRKYMKTPPRSSLPNFNCKPWNQDPEFLKGMEPDPVAEARVRRKLAETKARREREQQAERVAWAERYYRYRLWTDFSDDPVAVRSREKFAKAREQAAAEAAAQSVSTPAPGSKPEPSRRTGRWATEHDFERVLRESEQEAKETKEKEERAARAKTASAKEATIPDQYWDEEEFMETVFIDKTHKVTFERSFARLEFGEPIDNFTVEECEIFEKLYLEFPKQWGKIAEALPNRDFKACIQHYYLVKHNSNLKEKYKKQGKKKGKRQ
jgi:hypothetical protein